MKHKGQAVIDHHIIEKKKKQLNHCMPTFMTVFLTMLLFVTITLPTLLYAKTDQKNPYTIQKNDAIPYVDANYPVSVAGITEAELQAIEEGTVNKENKYGEIITDIDFKVYDEYGWEMSGYGVLQEREADKFLFQFLYTGTYEIEVTVTAEKNGSVNYYKDKKKITVKELGFEKCNIAVAKECTKKTRVKNYKKILSYESADKAIATVNKDGVIRGISAGTTSVSVTGITMDGAKVTSFCNVTITDPVLKESFPKLVMANQDYFLNVEGMDAYSEYTITSSNPKVLPESGDDYAGYGWRNEIIYRGFSSGSTKVTLVVDGKKLYSGTVKVYNPELPEYIVSVVGKTNLDLTQIKLPSKDSKLQFKSSDWSVLQVNSTLGRIKAASEGVADVTVTIDGFSYPITVVGVRNKTVATALNYALSVIGSPYSQEKRMQKGYYDCSSLIWKAYKSAGTSIGGSSTYAPTAAELARYSFSHGQQIKKAEAIKPGDLLFYNYEDSSRYLGIGHVSMVVYADDEIEQSENGKSRWLLLVDAGSSGVGISYGYFIEKSDEVYAARPVK